MIILAFESTAKTASVAVCDEERMLGLYNIENGLTHSELLLPMAENLLKSLRLSFSDVELLAASVGPGSFTGVRIGVSLVKGIAFSKNIPCVGVSALEALAENAKGLSGLIVPVMDARRSQVYTAVFKDGERLTPDRAIAINQLAEELLKYKDEVIYLTGDGYANVYSVLLGMGLNAVPTPTLLVNENAYSVARAAYRKYLRGEAVTDLEIAPTYLRMPQAERERLERLSEKSIKEETGNV